MSTQGSAAIARRLRRLKALGPLVLAGGLAAGIVAAADHPAEPAPGWALPRAAAATVRLDAVASASSALATMPRGGPADECAGRHDDHTSATRHDPAFNTVFRQGFARVDDVVMHYVVGGIGQQVLVLLPGWPESWYEFRKVMPELAKTYTVVAVDLPGLGDSKGQPPSYDKQTLARYVHGLVADRLGYERVGLVGHDLGAGVAFQYAAQYRDQVNGLMIMDYEMPGPVATAAFLRQQVWWFAFHDVPELPEQLIQGRQRTYQSWFYTNLSVQKDAIDARAVREYVRTACDPVKLSGGLDLYRTIDEDEAADTPVAADPLDIPVRTLSAGAGPTSVPGGVAPAVQPFVASPVRNISVAGSGHWIPEEQPQAVVQEIMNFFGGATGAGRG